MTSTEEPTTEVKKRTRSVSVGRTLILDHVRVTVIEVSGNSVRVEVDGAMIVDVDGRVPREPRLKKFRRVD